MAILTFSHELDEAPDGNIRILSCERKEVDDDYSDEYDEGAPRKRQRITGDVIVEFDRETGGIVWEWRAVDHLDPVRIGYETLSNYWVRRGLPDAVDWSHANNLLCDASDDSVVGNFRYQATNVKIDRETNQIRWVFGEPTRRGDLSDKLLKAEGDLQSPNHQYSPQPTPECILMIFENGNYRGCPFGKPRPVVETHSRRVEYEIHETAMTARQLW